MLAMEFAVFARNQILSASLRNDLRTATSFLISDQIEVFDLFAGQGCRDDARDTLWMFAGRPTLRETVSVLDFARFLLIGLVLTVRLLRGIATILLVWVGNAYSLSDWPSNHPPLGYPGARMPRLLSNNRFNKIAVLFGDVLTACPYQFSR